MITSALYTTGAVGLMGLVCGGSLALAAKFFGVKEDPLVEAIVDALPGANCGGCGYAGCDDYAHAIAKGASPGLCAPGGAEVITAISKLLGVEAHIKEPQVAIVLCAGDRNTARQKFNYNGIIDCAAADSIAGGDKSCSYGCLGYGSCLNVCPVNAIEITETGIAVIHPEICIACGKCVAACPRAIIKMVPRSATVHILCSSKDKGPVTRTVCDVGCIGCRMCTKIVKNDAFVMDGFLARRNYTEEVDNLAIVDTCPGKCIVNLAAKSEDTPVPEPGSSLRTETATP